jgi:hypothetical protein
MFWKIISNELLTHIESIQDKPIPSKNTMIINRTIKANTFKIIFI